MYIQTTLGSIGGKHNRYEDDETVYVSIPETNFIGKVFFFFGISHEIIQGITLEDIWKPKIHEWIPIT